MRHFSTNAFSMTKWPGSVVIAFVETVLPQDCRQIGQHLRATAQHHAVVFGGEVRKPDLVK